MIVGVRRGGAGTPTADVRVVEPLGSELDAIFSIDAPTAGGRELAAAEDTEDVMPGLAYNGVARLGPRAMVRPGDRVTFRVDASRLHLFDPDTGRAWRNAQNAAGAVRS